MSLTTIKTKNYSLSGQNVNYLRDWLLDAIATDPTVAQALQLKFNTTDGRLKVHDGTNLKTLAYMGDLDSYVRYRGTLDASSGNLPTSATSTVLTGEPIEAGDKWLVTVAGAIPGLLGENDDNLRVGDFITAIVDNASTAAEFVAINAAIDNGATATSETISLATLPADTPTVVSPTTLTTVEIASVRDSAGLDLTGSIVLTYGANNITLQSSVELTNLDIRLIGKPL